MRRALLLTLVCCCASLLAVILLCNLLVPPHRRPWVRVAEIPDAGATAHGAETLKRLDSASVPPLDPYDLARRLLHQSGAAPMDPAPAAQSSRLGDRRSFWTLDLDRAVSRQISATLRYISPEPGPASLSRGQILMWVQDGLSVDQDALELSANVFEERLYPTVRHHFGPEWSPGIDGDVRLTILNAAFSGAAGYFSSTDEFPRTISGSSNDREMFYINPEYLVPGTPAYDATLAHEFQHMVHWFADSNEDPWVNEGAAELAVHLCGYPVDGVISAFARQPDTQLTTWDEAGSPQHYGASLLFMAYFAQRFGPDLTRQVVAEPANGMAGFTAVMRRNGISLTFEDLFADWILANYLDGMQHIAIGDAYSYQSLDVGVQAERILSVFPGQGSGTVHQFAADYIELEADQDLWLEFEGNATVRVIPNEAHSGDYQWWSNRGDNSDMTLTRTFDLGGVSRATLKAWLWYEIERGWDYAYVQVSTDGGRTWKVLSGQHTASDDPNGSGYGPGYTGSSSQVPGSADGWFEESFDLSPFAGQQIQVRFEYLTDDSVHGDGFAVDDIRIPELNYSHDGERGDEGWIAQGFVRHDNILPQRYVVLLAPLCEPFQVQKVKLDTLNRGATVVHRASPTCTRILMIVAATTPYTNQEAPYRYRITPIQSAMTIPHALPRLRIALDPNA